MTPRPSISVLVIDDSAHNRRLLTQLLESEPDVQVVDWAVDGEEGLRKVIELRPDVVTVDLEMPRLGGYTFLRLLRNAAPTPVIVISSYAHKADVFKALELGAFDFIAKPQKLTPEVAREPARGAAGEGARGADGAPGRCAAGGPGRVPKEAPAKGLQEVPFVVAVAASTGGPPAVQRLLEALAVEPTPCVLVCQHMPVSVHQGLRGAAGSHWPVQRDGGGRGGPVIPGHVYIAPGGRHMVVEEQDGGLVLKVARSGAKDRYAPSVDRLFISVAQGAGGQGAGGGAHGHGLGRGGGCARGAPGGRRDLGRVRGDGGGVRHAPGGHRHRGGEAGAAAGRDRPSAACPGMRRRR